MSQVEDFLSPGDEADIIEAIRLAEDHTSGEIRVHLEPHCKTDPYGRAKEVFNFLHMNNTRNRNGVLIYVAVEDHSLVILGDKGIDKVVPDDFWESTKDIIISHFKNKNIKQGLVEGISMAGLQLKEYFPYNAEDVDELPNTISFGKKEE